jgi:uncharacterized delta-60 repeat protein
MNVLGIRSAAWLSILVYICAYPVNAREGDFIKSWANEGRLMVFDEHVRPEFPPAFTEIRPDHSLISTVKCRNDATSFYGICVWKRLPDGNVDTSFGEKEDGRAELSHSSTTWPSAITSTPTGKIVVAATLQDPSHPHSVKLWRLRADGVQDFWAAWPAIFTFNFNPDMPGSESRIADIASYADDHALVAGTVRNESNGWDLAFVKVNQHYVGLEQSFGNAGVTLVPMGKFDVRLRKVELQPDGRVLFAGWVSHLEDPWNDQQAIIGRLTADGRLDPSFADGGIYLHPAIVDSNIFNSIDVDSSGRVVATGDFGGFINGDQNYYFRVARFLDNGLPDTTFGPGGERIFASGLTARAMDSSFVVNVLSDDRILLAGLSSIPSPNGGLMYVNSLTRLRSNGDLDTTFGDDGFVHRTFYPPNPSGLDFVFLDSLSVGSSEIILGGSFHESTPAFMKLEWESLFQNGYD